MTEAPQWAENALDEDAQTDGPGVFDYFLAVFIGAATVALMSVWAFPCLHPSAWADAAVGAGLRPPEHLFPGFVRLFSSLAFAVLPVDAALFALTCAARVLAGVCVALVYFLFGDVLNILMRGGKGNRVWNRRVRRLVILLGTMLFACSDPLWHAGQALTADTVLLLFTILLAALFFRFLCGGRLSLLYCCIFICGMMCAESPAGVFAALFLFIASFVAQRRLGDLNLPFFDPLVMQVSKWRMSFFLFQGFALGIVLNFASFCVMGGWSASGWGVTDLIIKSVVRYGLVAAGAASIVGWGLFAVFVLLPIVVSVLLFAGATDEDNFLPYRSGIVYLLVGAVSIMQLSAFKPLWFWTWSAKGEAISSLYLRGICTLSCALAATLSLAVLGVAVYVRNNHRIMRQRFPEFLESPAEAARIAAQRRAVRVFRRWGGWLFPVLLAAVVVPGRRQTALRGELSVIRDYVRETVAEAGDSRWLFTDGFFDAALELRSVAGGGDLKAISMMSSHSDFDKALRVRGVSRTSEEENWSVLENGPLDALRTWVCDRAPGSVKFAAQVGFEFWKRGRRPMPPAAGLLVRPDMAPEEAQKGAAAAKELAARLMALRRPGWRRGFSDPLVDDLSDVVMWRVSRVARLRADALELAGEKEKAVAETDLSDSLDKANESLVGLLETVRRKARESGPQLTPREGLKLALNRADFALASRYAIPVLNSDPDDAAANFGMGMNYLLEKKYARAADYLRRVLKRRPKEAAVLNNLAVCLVNLNELAEAETNAVRALKIMPNSAEIKETLQMISNAKKDAANREAAKGAGK